MGAVVVMTAEQRGIVEIGRAALGPFDPVVGFGPGAGDVAALRLTGRRSEQQGSALGGGEEAFLAAEVEDLRGTAEDGGDDVGGAGQVPGFGCGDRGAAEDLGDAGVFAELVEVDRDDHRGGVPAVDR
ncbi:MAG TPA: hypothetical protein VIQ30_22860, partial [Pseudonocardia sp.]